MGIFWGIIGVFMGIGALSYIITELLDRPTKKQRELWHSPWNHKFNAQFSKDQYGVKVINSRSQGSFKSAGIQINDYILKINNKEIHIERDVVDFEADYGEEVVVEVLRGVQKLTFSVFIIAFKDGRPLNSDTQSIIRQMNIARNSDYTLAYDTNILIKYPFLFSKYINTNKIFLSRQVTKELDKQKNNKEIGHLARNAMSMIEKAQIDGADITFTTTNDSYTESQNLDPSSPDDRIIASYLYMKDKTKRNIFFISEDRGARVIARQAGLETIDWPA